jgi:hypothetical protein
VRRNGSFVGMAGLGFKLGFQELRADQPGYARREFFPAFNFSADIPVLPVGISKFFSEFSMCSQKSKEQINGFPHSFSLFFPATGISSLLSPKFPVDKERTSGQINFLEIFAERSLSE